MFADLRAGGIAIAHNGNLTNFMTVREQLVADGAIFQSTSDSEVILHLIARSRKSRLVEKFIDALSQVEGGYALVALTNKKLIGVRDPLGIRPLVLGELNGKAVFASETRALNMVGARFVRDVEHGEMIIVSDEGVESVRPFPAARARPCVFEYVYFARPDSILNDINVAKVRTEMGRELARLHPVEADLVVPVPDSGNYAALGFAQQLNIPYDHAFVRNHYIGRTFLQPTQLIRDFNVRVKLNLIKEAVEGKRVVVVDDSIVRGTTAKARVTTMREAGAKEVHVRISCPPHRHACHYGIDFPDPANLLANQCTLDEIRDYLEADSLGYLDVPGMVRATGQALDSFCLACFNGEYPIPVDPGMDKYIMERRRQRTNLLVTQPEHPELFGDLK